MTIFEESGIRFVFDENFDLVSSNNEANISKIKKCLQSTKDVDFFGFYQQQKIFFLEVTNYRGSVFENDIDKLTTEAAQKLRDTVAMIVGASRNTTHQAEFWERLHQNIGKATHEIIYIFWLEEDLPSNPRYKNRLKTITDNLKQKCKWLTSKIRVQNVQTCSFEGMSANFV